MDMKEHKEQGWLGKDQSPDKDSRKSQKGKLPGPDNSMKKAYPKSGGREDTGGFPDAKAYDHSLKKTYPK